MTLSDLSCWPLGVTATSEKLSILPHQSLCSSSTPRKIISGKPEKYKKKGSQGQQNFQAISIKAAGSHTIRAFSVTHQCVINMHSKAHVTLYDAAGV